MGTMHNWMKVLWSSGLFGGSMLLFNIFERKSSKIKPVLSPLGVLAYALTGLFMGVVNGFEWKELHWPVVLIAISVLVGSLVVGRIYHRPERSRSNSTTAPRDITLG